MKLTYSIDTREQWLQAAAELLAHDRFKPEEYDVPPTHISTGWPSGTKRNGTGKTIGQCWYGLSSADGKAQLFISPLLRGEVDVVATLAHELIHATVGPEAKHGKVFKRCALAIGLAGKMTATYAGPEFAEWVKARVVTTLGPYPHAQLNPALGPKKQTTRMIKCECDDCGYVVRTTAKWIATVGAPICPCNSEQMKEAA